MIKIETTLCKGNNQGVGFVRIPAIHRKGFRENASFRVTISDDHRKHTFYGRIKDYSGLGVYVPKDVVKESGLMQRKVTASFERIDGFYAVVGSDGRFYIPNDVTDRLNLCNNDVVKVSAEIDFHKHEKSCRVKRYEHENGAVDFCCMFGPAFSRKNGVFKIERRADVPKLNKFYKIVADMDTALDGDNIIAFHGNKTPIMISNDIRLDEITYYLGHFFADGTKKGNNWGLCLSTFEQANVFIKLHKKIITDADIHSYISFSGPKVKNLIEVWHNKTGIIADKTIFHKTGDFFSSNRNEYGTLVIKEYRKLTQMFYNRLIDAVFEEINNGDKELAIDFICGVLEGDGSPSSGTKGHIIISTNKEDVTRLEQALEVSRLPFKVCRESNPEKIYIRIGALGILANIPYLEDKLFRYYPKRRNKFIQRFSSIGACKFIMGRQKKASAWVKAYLRDNKILDDNYNMTEYGKEVRSCLRRMIKEVK